jgi:hypothetical protein
LIMLSFLYSAISSILCLFLTSKLEAVHSPASRSSSLYYLSLMDRQNNFS